jgi:uncharacterized membrane protein
VRLVGTARHQPRLLLSAALGLVVYLLLPGRLEPQTRGIIAWDAGCAAFLIAVLTMMLRATIERMERRAKIQDENRVAILVLCVAAVCMSLFAVGYELHVAKVVQQAAAGWRIALAAVTLVLSWGFTHTIFALHYAHEYYEDPKKPRLCFPGDLPPDYADFLYYAFVIGMTCQVSDVEVAERELRRLTLVHSILSFFFNTVILALAINLGASVF